MPTVDNFQFVDAETPQLSDGEVLVGMLYISVDPYLRGRMRDGRSYIPPSTSMLIARFIGLFPHYS